jgi:hypothetical protein
MIRLPQRSVTRFFIPLIDVLTLLFCLFLLLPVVEPSEGVAQNQPEQDRLRQLEQELERQKTAVRKLEEELKQGKGKPLQERLAVRVLEIDPETGKLFYRDPERVELNGEADARSLINRDLREKAVGQRELFYLVLYPRDAKSPYPTRGQREQYDRWFRGVAVGYDVPGKGPEEK